MITLAKCFGIPSWLPDNEPARTQRKERINKLFKQLNDLWPTIDILVIAQNWQDFKPIATKNKQIIKLYPQLGILGARKALREEFLQAGYDYIIMFDDDAIISYDNSTLPQIYMQYIDEHPNGFCFMPGKNSRFHPYCGAQLNLCAISRYIYEKEPMVNIDPQLDEGYEDSIFACLLHHKYSSYEFLPPAGIKCIQWCNRNEKVASTWAETMHAFDIMTANTNRIQEWIAKNKNFPPHYKALIEKEYKPPENAADGKKDCFLYF